MEEEYRSKNSFAEGDDQKVMEKQKAWDSAVVDLN